MRSALPYFAARLEGHIKGSEQSASVLVFGKQSLLFELRQLFFTSNVRTTILRTYPPFFGGLGAGATRRHRERFDDAIVIETRRLAEPSAPGFAATTLVDAYVAMNEPPEVSIEGNFDTEHRRVLRVARRLGLSSRVGLTHADVGRFHAELYLPMVTARHGERGVVLPRSVLERQFTPGRDLVLFLEREGRPIAGIVLKFDPASPTLVEFLHVGAIAEVLDDRPLYGRVTALLYSLAFQAAWDRGSREVWLGSAYPSLTNGSLLQKKRFGCRFVPSRYGIPFVVALTRRESTRLLHHVPLLAWRLAGFYGLSAPPEDEAWDGPATQRLASRWKTGPFRSLEIAATTTGAAAPVGEGLRLLPFDAAALVQP